MYVCNECVLLVLTLTENIKSLLHGSVTKKQQLN